MSATLSNGCPACGSVDAWNGIACNRCASATKTSQPTRWSAIARAAAVFCGVVILLLLGLLLELAVFKRWANRLGVGEYTSIYLGGSMAIGFAQALASYVQWKNQGHLTRFSNWLIGLGAVWIAVSGGVVFDLLPNAVAKWLPSAYLAFVCVPLLAALWLYRDIVGEFLAHPRKAMERSFPPTPKWWLIGDGVFHIVFASICAVMLIQALADRRQVDDALDQMTVRLDKTERLLNEIESLPLAAAAVVPDAVVNDLQEITGRSRSLLDGPLSKGQREQLVIIMSRAGDQIRRANELMSRLVDKLKREQRR